MKRMKIISTGEIVEVLGFNFAWKKSKETIDYTDSKGIVHEGAPVMFFRDLTPAEEAELDAIDWEQRRYEIAKEMLPAVYRNDHEGAYNMTVAEIVSDSILYADELIKQLKGGDKCD